MFRNRIRAYFERKDCRLSLTVISPSESPAQSPTTCQAEPQPASDDLPQNRQFRPQDAYSRPRRRRMAELLHLILWPLSAHRRRHARRVADARRDQNVVNAIARNLASIDVQVLGVVDNSVATIYAGQATTFHGRKWLKTMSSRCVRDTSEVRQHRQNFVSHFPS